MKSINSKEINKKFHRLFENDFFGSVKISDENIIFYEIISLLSEGSSKNIERAYKISFENNLDKRLKEYISKMNF